MYEQSVLNLLTRNFLPSTLSVSIEGKVLGCTGGANFELVVAVAHIVRCLDIAFNPTCCATRAGLLNLVAKVDTVGFLPQSTHFQRMNTDDDAYLALPSILYAVNNDYISRHMSSADSV